MAHLLSGCSCHELPGQMGYFVCEETHGGVVGQRGGGGFPRKSLSDLQVMISLCPPPSAGSFPFQVRYQHEL